MNVRHLIYSLTAGLLIASTVSAGLLEDMGIDSEASKEVKEQKYYPEAKPERPAQHSGGEGVPPLPLPAVPLRRTEKKNPPRPPVLIAKLSNDDRVDWATSPADADNLLKWMAREMNVNFSTINLPENQIPNNARDIPVLYKSGIKAFAFTPQQREQLRQYLLSGGTLILNAYCGHPDFARSALKEMALLLPERPPYRLALDHPLYHSYYEIETIKYRPLALQANARNGVPSEIGIDINTRTAVFFFRYDVSTAWDGEASDRKSIIGYEQETAKRLGANLMAYITAERNTAISMAKALEFVDETPQSAGKLTIAQAKYDGLWKTRDAGLSMLLNVFHSKTQAPVHFESMEVDLDSPRLFDAPFVYLTGQMDFNLTEGQRANLRRYLANGGVLFCDATCGRPSFDTAFRRELRQVLPEATLERIPTSHLLFQYPNAISGVTPRLALAHRLQTKGKMEPLLYGISIKDHLAVIYSPFDLSGGWAMAQGPYNEGLEANDSLALGVNILSYLLTQ